MGRTVRTHEVYPLGDWPFRVVAEESEYDFKLTILKLWSYPYRNVDFGIRRYVEFRMLIGVGCAVRQMSFERPS